METNKMTFNKNRAKEFSRLALDRALINYKYDILSDIEHKIRQAADCGYRITTYYFDYSRHKNLFMDRHDENFISDSVKNKIGTINKEIVDIVSKNGYLVDISDSSCNFIDRITIYW